MECPFNLLRAPDERILESLGLHAVFSGHPDASCVLLPERACLSRSGISRLGRVSDVSVSRASMTIMLAFGDIMNRTIISNLISISCHHRLRHAFCEECTRVWCEKRSMFGRFRCIQRIWVSPRRPQTLDPEHQPYLKPKPSALNA